MAVITSDSRTGNGQKKTRQGKGKNTKFGTKPQTHLGAVPKKTLNRYKKRRQYGRNDWIFSKCNSIPLDD